MIVQGRTSFFVLATSAFGYSTARSGEASTHMLPSWLTIENLPDKHDDKDKRSDHDRVASHDASHNNSNNSNRGTKNEFSLGTIHDKEAVAQKLQKAFGYSEDEKLVEGN